MSEPGEDWRAWNGSLDAVRRPRLRLCALAVACLAATPSAGGEEPASAPAPEPMVLSGDDTVPLFHRFERLYAEAFRRLGIPLRIVGYQLARRAALLESGAIDGEIARALAYGEAHPQLVRVDEPLFEFGFALFAARPEVRLDKLEELAGKGWNVEYRRGIVVCETALRKLVPPERLTDIATTEQGVKKLLAGRTDLYCELEPGYVAQALRALGIEGADRVRRVLRFAQLPTYGYLHAKHAALAPRLAAVLREMKADGTYDRFLAGAAD